MTNNKGFALVSALVIMSLLLALGAASMTMSQLGFTAISAEKKYQLANWAAEYGVKDAVRQVLPNAICPSGTFYGTIGSGINSSNYSYYYIETPIQNYCFIHATGTKGSAKVVKTAVIQRAGTYWGGIVIRGGHIRLGGSAAIAGCDDEDNNYANRCGVVPGVIYQAGSLTYTGAGDLNPIITCAGEGRLRGFEGNPPLQPTQLPNDLIPTYFGVTDINNNGSAWDEFLSLIENKYGVDITPLPPQPVNSIPETCKTEPDQFCCKTRNSTTVDCYNNSNCTGTVVKTIDLTQCRNGSNPNPQENPIFIKIDAPLLIQHNLSQGLTNPDLRNTSSSGTVTISTSLTNTKIVSGGTVKISLDSGKTMEDSLIFANNLNFDLKASGDRVKGGIFYAKNETEINATGGPRLGTVEKPILLLAGDTSMRVPGNLTVNGMVYTNATTISITGSVALQGTLISASTNATINNTGNGTIQFNKRVLDALCNLFDGNPGNGICDAGGLINPVLCGGGNKNDYLINTKITLY